MPLSASYIKVTICVERTCDYDTFMDSSRIQLRTANYKQDNIFHNLINGFLPGIVVFCILQNDYLLNILKLFSEIDYLNAKGLKSL